METRILFSADLAGVAGLHDGLATVETRTWQAPAREIDRAESVALGAPREIVFVDVRVDDLQTLVDDLERASERALEVVLIRADEDALSRIGDTLADRRELAAVHLISHGEAGQLQLGRDPLDLVALLGRADDVAGWAESLSADADLLLYGCDLAASEDGRHLVDTLADLTGADVAASDDATGARTRGGDWALEYARGAVTSEVAFGDGVRQDYSATFATHTVSTLADSGAGSLRQAIIDANSSNDSDTIVFGVAGTINLVNALPPIIHNVAIDGTTAPGHANAPVVTLDGSATGPGEMGLDFVGAASSGSQVRGLAIVGFDGAGIYLTNSGNHSITGNYIGTDGAVAVPNTTGILLDSSWNNTIGGAAATERNVISGNDVYGIAVTGSPSTGNWIAGNHIGVDASGSAAVGNTNGIDISAGASDNIVGGTTAAEGNTISGNTGDGIKVRDASTTGNALLLNVIVDNVGQGIDLGSGGVDPNDPGDVDSGANNRQNYPVLTSVEVDAGGVLRVGATVDSTPNTDFRMDLYASATGDPSGHGEAERHLHTFELSVGGTGQGTFVFGTSPFSGTVASGDLVSATLTSLDAGGSPLDTSEFSANVLATVVDTNTAPTFISTVTPTFTDHVITTGADGARSVVTADVDGDGDPDVLSASQLDDTIAWHENDGAGGFTERVISTSANGARSVATADVDGDGDLDVLSASADNDKVAWYENDGGGSVGALDGTPTFVEGGAAVVLDAEVAVFDAELSALDSFDGATLTLVRDAGANAQDRFSAQAAGTLGALTEGGALTVGGTAIGTVTSNSSGTLALSFGADATNARVDEALRQIAYENASDTPPPSVSIGWTFDDGNAGAQGAGGTAQGMGTITVTIVPVNDAPTVTSADTATVEENRTDALTIVATDADGDTPTFSIVGGVDAARFSLDPGTGALSFASAPDFESPGDADADNTYEVAVQADDGNGGTDTQTVAVTVTGVNEAPIITSASATTVEENRTEVLGVTATDVDGDAPTFSIAGGADAALFDLDPNTGALSFLAAPDFEAPADAGADNIYEVVVQADDGNGGTDTRAIAVTVTGVNEAPVITSAATAGVEESQSAVLSVTATDVDGDALTYSIAGGADAALIRAAARYIDGDGRARTGWLADALPRLAQARVEDRLRRARLRLHAGRRGLERHLAVGGHHI